MRDQIVSEGVLDLSRIEFNPSITFDCGQAFRWFPSTRNPNEWIGTVGKYVVGASRSKVRLLAGSDEVDFETRLRTYLSFSDNLRQIRSSLPSDPFLASAARQYAGLRLLTQDPWECLISFVCSINSNIPSIRMKIENLARRFGSRISLDDGTSVYTFPEPESLAFAEKEDLVKCKTGFRWKYIQFLAQRVVSGQLDLGGVGKMPYEVARDYLVSETSRKTFGVGPKVADCVLLFAYHKLEAFPIDVWIARCIKTIYLEHLKISDWNSLTTKRYYELSAALRQHFGANSGYAQQYLFAKFRNDASYSKKSAGLKGCD